MSHIWNIAVSDSWVVDENKTESGHGEAKLYVGSRDDSSYRDFFGSSGFSLECKLKKSDLLNLHTSLQNEYFYPTFNYRAISELKRLYESRIKAIENILDEDNYLILNEQSHLKPPRAYVNSDSYLYRLLREISLPGITYLKIIRENESSISEFSLKVIADNTQVELSNLLGKVTDLDPGYSKSLFVDEIHSLKRLRKSLLSNFRLQCPFLLVKDINLLKICFFDPSLSVSNGLHSHENSLVLSSAYSELFNLGYITFDSDWNLIVSKFVDENVIENLGLIEGMPLEVLRKGHGTDRKRLDLLAKHRDSVFLG